LDTYRYKFPKLSEIYKAFIACAFPIFLWSYFNLFFEIPGWYIRLSTWDLIGAIAYIQTFTLIESILILLIMILVVPLLQVRIFRYRFSPVSATIIMITTVWFMIAHYFDVIIFTWSLRRFIPWLIMYFLSIILYVNMLRYERIERIVSKFIDRISILTMFYVTAGTLSIFIVIIRNLA
jgi:hypothetical protein